MKWIDPMRHFDTDSLETLVTIVDRGGFTAAGEALGKTQAAVSVIVSKLEARLGKRLLERSRRGVKPTVAGEALIGYARRILAMEDEALAAIMGDEAEGRVRLAVPDDFLDLMVAPLMGAFAKRFPRVQLEMRCDLSFRIEPMLERGEVDLAIITRDPARPVGEVLRHEPRVWCAARDHRPELITPLPLAMFPEGCRCRPTALAALDAIGRPWRIAYTSSHLPGVYSAVNAGLAVTVLGISSVPPAWRRLGAAEGFPDLPDLDIALVAPRGASTATKHLASFIRERVVEGQIAA
ncbi:LysR substrate-binding domain-containing protein [Labrys wisconsinensis]|uniref:DNA-binding transcriptional LysR family regulator n=1 Tax=Labrys wisconsinensis TaxID=425677 RepID=A0ABU0J9Z3_9HYPH|nr:LysR substrate-binding domain-containing protein [Labrys wisconsinensis]MDQ0471087.1 DNA-binding transcriptional LysR family regulator [Labrys wisconsinensis]